MPTEWWLRPVSSACRVGEHSAVVWNRLYLRPFAASFSKFGVWQGPPKALVAPKPTSSSRMTSTLGAPLGGRNVPDRRVLRVRVLGVVGRQADVRLIRDGKDGACDRVLVNSWCSPLVIDRSLLSRMSGVRRP